jgi:hypothetical protein
VNAEPSATGREDAATEPAPPKADFPSVAPDAEFLAIISSALNRLKELPPSHGYEPLLIANGIHPILARGITFLTVRAGRRYAHESKRRRPVLDAIRFLSKSRQKRAVASRAKLLLAAWTETSIIETVFDEIGLSEFEFIRLLEAITKGDNENYRRLTEIAALVGPQLVLSRGPKVSAASSSHALLLENKIKLKSIRNARWRNDRTADNCDALTEATRTEFGIPHFDSRSAKRRSKRTNDLDSP